jgi:hypothetical protein
MAFRIRDLMISVLPTAAADAQGCVNCTGTTGQGCGGGGTFGGGCPNCTGTTGQGCQGGTFGGGCPNCTGTTGQGCFQGTGNGCPNCSGTTPYGFAAPGCPNCSGTTADYGCRNCSGTTGDLCAHAAALMACGLCTGVSPLLAEDQRPRALGLLRQQLQGVLSEVEAEERRIDEASFPKTLEEAEELEKRLKEALAEVRSRKAGLKKG